ncbi:MAG: CRISPR-associated helicase Cas3' [Alkaliphilus sp.]
MKYIAHTKDGKNYIDDNCSQSLKDHLNNVSKYTEKYAESFNAGEVGAVIGLIHDLGKYQSNFQKRIRGGRLKVDHATLGAKILIDMHGEIGRLYGMVVSAHHTGLKDSGNGSNMGDNSYSSRLNNYKGQDIDYGNEVSIPSNFKHKQVDCDGKSSGFAMATYLKMLFSALVDADWTDTEEYIKGISRSGLQYTMNKLNNRLKKERPINDGSFLNNIRAEILMSCQKAAQSEQGLFTLTVPTGGGKTLSSLSFALEHAIKHDLKRIIYVIPYTSIIEQNADVISKSLGREYVLEHHSNVEVKLKGEEGNELGGEEQEKHLLEGQEEQRRLKWASENWDIPIVMTTNVQFFESFFSNKPSKTRKLHNISESVIIFDEAQMLPRELLSPSMYAISELVKNYRVTAVLCSATQPAISKYKYDSLNITEIINNPPEIFEKLKRVNYKIIGKKNDQEILELLLTNQKVLCVVNSRRHAHALYLLAKDQLNVGVYHLSTLMHAVHRREVLKNIKADLDSNKNIVVISTSLIEAGVDIDFPIVMRSIAGMDSIIQAGGRSNREGKLKAGTVMIFEPTSDAGKIPKAIQSFVSITKEVISVLQEKAFEIEGIKMYFETLYHGSSVNDVLDTKNILDEFELKGNSVKLNFETVAKKYKIIEENTHPIIIDNDGSNGLIKEIRKGIFEKDTVRKLQQYSVSIYHNEYIKLLNDNAIEILRSGYEILNNRKYYNNEFGLDIFTEENKNGECHSV